MVKYLDIAAGAFILIFLIGKMFFNSQAKPAESEVGVPSVDAESTAKSGYKPSMGMKVFVLLLLLISFAFTVLKAMVGSD